MAKTDSEKAPTVVTSAKYRVRLRGSNIPALKGSISGTDHKGKPFEDPYLLPPNKWVAVNERVYHFLKAKYDKEIVREVKDWIPGGENESAQRDDREEIYQPYIIEFQ